MRLHLFLIIFVPFLVITIAYIKYRRVGEILERLYPSADIHSRETKELAYSVLKLAGNKSSLGTTICVETTAVMADIIGLVKNHIRFCTVDDCKCRQLQLGSEECCGGTETPMAEKKPKGAANGPAESGDIVGTPTAYLQEKYKGLEGNLYEILNMTLRHMRNRENSSEGEVIQAYINYHMLSRMFNALYNLMLAEEFNLTLFQQFQLYCLR
ncbi:MAG: hypothetical protein P4M11_11240 [Candidatus Pacebacteria bacterium]|nr:hypothetical protein [Candidatus Paceibacterota bacterium]